MKLTNEQKAEIFDNMMLHAETIESGEWAEGKLLPAPVAAEIRGHAIGFLRVARSEMEKFKRFSDG